MTPPITDIRVIMSDDSGVQPPPGYLKIPVDLNKGSGGKYIYLCYKRSEKDSPVTGLTVLLGKNTPPPAGYIKLPEDLNAGAGGEFIYFAYKKDGDAPIKDIILQATGDASQYAPEYRGGTYKKIPVDLNKGAKGTYIFTYYWQPERSLEKEFDAAQRINAEMIKDFNKEYELSRAQISDNRFLVRLMKLNSQHERFIGKNTAYKKEIKVKTGSKRSEQSSFAVEVGMSASASYGGFSAEINAKFAYSQTNSYETYEEREETETVDIGPVDYDRTFVLCNIVDILRVVSIPSGNTISEFASNTSKTGQYITDEQAQFRSVK